MTVLSTAGASMAAHSVHYAIVLGGLAGLALLLAPYALERLHVGPSGPRDQHQDRIRVLRDLAASGRLADADADDTLTAVRAPERRAPPTTPTTALSVESEESA